MNASEGWAGWGQDCGLRRSANFEKASTVVAGYAIANPPKRFVVHLNLMRTE